MTPPPPRFCMGSQEQPLRGEEDVGLMTKVEEPLDANDSLSSHANVMVPHSNVTFKNGGRFLLAGGGADDVNSWMTSRHALSQIK